MSCYEWESGTITLPRDAFGRVLKTVQSALTAHVTGLLADTQRTIDRARREKASWDVVDRTYQLDEALSDAVYRCYRQDGDAKPRSTPLLPLKKDFAPATSATVVFRAGECGARFDRAQRTVHWSVEENNHSCDRAYETWLAKALFPALARVEWTRGTGGTIVGNDEYNRDSREDGGGGNYPKRSFGPRGR